MIKCLAVLRFRITLHQLIILPAGFVKFSTCVQASIAANVPSADAVPAKIKINLSIYS